MPRKIICADCGRERRYHARDRCRRCYHAWYQRQRWKDLPDDDRERRLAQMRELARKRRRATKAAAR